MDLVEIYIVSAEALQARLRRGDNVTARTAAQKRTVTHRHPELGCDDGVAAALAERLAQHFFGGAAVAIDVRGIEQRDSLVEAPMHDRASLFRIVAHPEI